MSKAFKEWCKKKCLTEFCIGMEACQRIWVVSEKATEKRVVCDVVEFLTNNVKKTERGVYLSASIIKELKQKYGVKDE